jgi:hypothetical protein
LLPALHNPSGLTLHSSTPYLNPALSTLPCSAEISTSRCATGRCFRSYALPHPFSTFATSPCEASGPRQVRRARHSRRKTAAPTNPQDMDPAMCGAMALAASPKSVMGGSRSVLVVKGPRRGMWVMGRVRKVAGGEVLRSCGFVVSI